MAWTILAQSATVPGYSRFMGAGIDTSRLLERFRFYAADPLLEDSWIPGFTKISFETSAEAPFWRTREKVFRRILVEREVIVSVKTSAQGKQTALKMNGVGLVNGEANRVFGVLKQFEYYPKISEHITEADFDELTDQLFVRGEAFRFVAEMLLQVSFEQLRFEQTSLPEVWIMNWRIQKGVFKGMAGRIRVEPVHEEKSLSGVKVSGRKKRSLIVLEAFQVFDKAPVPKIFLEFGLEVVLKAVAGKMRTHMESQL